MRQVHSTQDASAARSCSSSATSAAPIPISSIRTARSGSRTAAEWPAARMARPDRTVPDCSNSRVSRIVPDNRSNSRALRTARASSNRVRRAAGYAAHRSTAAARVCTTQPGTAAAHRSASSSRGLTPQPGITPRTGQPGARSKVATAWLQAGAVNAWRAAPNQNPGPAPAAQRQASRRGNAATGLQRQPGFRAQPALASFGVQRPGLARAAGIDRPRRATSAAEGRQARSKEKRHRKIHDVRRERASDHAPRSQSAAFSAKIRLRG